MIPIPLTWALLAAAASAASAGWWAYGAGKASVVVEQRAAEIKYVDRVRNVTKRVVVREQAAAAVTQALQQEVVTREVFRDRDCDSGPDAVRLFNAGIPAEGPGLDPAGGKLPAENPAGE